MFKYIRNLFKTSCPKCYNGKVKYIGEDWTGITWINIYECCKCNKKFI